MDSKPQLERIKANYESWVNLKEWIENTPLFRVIKIHSNTQVPLIIECSPNNFEINLNNMVKVEKAEDLPIEFIQHFFENSPFYNSQLK